MISFCYKFINLKIVFSFHALVSYKKNSGEGTHASISVRYTYTIIKSYIFFYFGARNSFIENLARAKLIGII